MMRQTSTPTASFGTPTQAAAPPRSLLRTLGIVGMVTSPGLALSILAQGPNMAGGVGAVLGLAFVFGWFANVLGLWLLRATGKSVAARIPLAVSLVTVPLAAVFNVYELLAPGSDTLLYTLTDLCWPLSMVMLLVTGIIAVFAGVLRGWTRFVPLVCGLWFPVGMLFKSVLSPEGSQIAGGIHGIVGWFLLGFVIYNAGRESAAR